MANVLRLQMGIVKFPEISLKVEVLNRKQCENLLFNFQKGVKALETITAQVYNAAQKDLFRIVNKGRVLIEECCKENWIHAAVMQLNNKEWFRELLLDFEYCFYTLCDISCQYYPHEQEKILAMKDDTRFYPASIDVVEEDRILLCGRLSKHLQVCSTKDCKDCRLVRYLEEYLMSLQRVEGGELDNIVFPCDYPRPKYGDSPESLGECNGGYVYLTDWMGWRSATKVIKIGIGSDLSTKLWKEASILGGLNHPNIIKFLCCGIHEAKNQFELVMEFGEMTLSSHLSAQGPLEEMDAIDIMLQIANGMCYLHDMKVAHRDLKPQNVVVIRPNDLQLINLECIQVKLLDFGISKIEVKESREMPTERSIMGTVGYMAPEAMANELSEVDPLKADVFSFGMMCSDILSRGKDNFYRVCDYRVYIQSKRPTLPRTYSEGLRSLVEDCWSSDPFRRPTFLDIQKRLTQLKHGMLKNSLESMEVTNATIDKMKGLSIIGMINGTIGRYWQHFLCHFSSFWHSFLNFIQWLWVGPQLVEGNCNNSSSSPIGIQEKLFQLEKKLDVVGCLGIVGMGGIGKSTLAKALSDHISHHFDVVCFVKFDLKDGKCTFSIKYNSLGMQNPSPQAQTLTKARDILKSLRETKKLLLVVDNVSKQSHLRELLGDGMLEYCHGMELITTSRDWDSLNQYVPMAGKVDMQTLEGNQPMTLFSRHAFGTNQSCSPYLKHVAKKIVDACCGLPLSLEVMGTCMQGETRLRIWERTLHRLLRARHDGSAQEKLWKTLRISFDELRCTNLENIPQGLTNLCSLEELNFSKCLSLRKIPKGFGGLTSLKTLYMSECEALEELDFSKCWSLKNTPKGFGGLTNLKNLNMSECEALEVFPVGLTNLCALEVLNFSKCQFLKKIPEGFGGLTSLQKLYMLGCKALEEFPPGMTNLRGLEELDFSKCRSLRRIPEGFVGLTRLKKLYMWECEALVEFPVGLTNLCALEELNFSKCRSLIRIPEGFGGLTRLKKLYMWECEALEEFPVGLTNLCALEELNFSKCWSLKKIPEGFGGLTSLKKLHMLGCEVLEEFPCPWTDLHGLEELIFSKCGSLTQTPKGCVGLSSLKNI